MRERDSQRKKVYRAEEVLKPYAKPLKSVADVEDFIEDVWSRKRIQDAFPFSVRNRSMPVVKDGRGTRIARGGSSHINIPLWARDTRVVIHEMTHTITVRISYDAPGHGWLFCQNLLIMTLHLMGRKAHDELKASFKQHRVRYTKPRVGKPLSPERRAALVATLAKAREAQMAAKRRED